MLRPPEESATLQRALDQVKGGKPLVSQLLLAPLIQQLLRLVEYGWRKTASQWRDDDISTLLRVADQYRNAEPVLRELRKRGYSLLLPPLPPLELRFDTLSLDPEQVNDPRTPSISQPKDLRFGQMVLLMNKSQLQQQQRWWNSRKSWYLRNKHGGTVCYNVLQDRRIMPINQPFLNSFDVFQNEYQQLWIVITQIRHKNDYRTAKDYWQAVVRVCDYLYSQHRTRFWYNGSATSPSAEPPKVELGPSVPNVNAVIHQTLCILFF